MKARRLRGFSTGTAVLLVCFPLFGADGTRHGDLFFRESLTAINDWEAILASMAGTDSSFEEPPAFPVAVDGGGTPWMNPIPPVLRFGEQARSETWLQRTNDEVRVVLAPRTGVPRVTTVAPGDVVIGFQHAGGGGKDKWYHAYHRQFDRLTRLRPVLTPFDARLNAAPDLKRGTNCIAVTLRNAVGRQLKLELNLHFHGTAETVRLESQTLTLEPDAAEVVRLPISLCQPGGGLLVVAIDGGGTSLRLPLLTYVEDVGAVLRGIEQQLADSPDPDGLRQVSDLRSREDAWLNSGNEWRALFLDAAALRDRLLLNRLDFRSLLFVKRKPFDSEQPFMDAHHLRNPSGGGIYRLQPVEPSGSVTPIVDSLGDGIYRDLCLHWNARKLLFSFGNGSDKWDGSQSYHIYEVGIDGEGLRQLTHGPKNDCEPFYLPDGRIGFTSDRSEHFVMCGGDRHAPNLFVMDADGSAVCQLSYNVFNEFSPTVLQDGRILYSRWEYNERSVTSLHNPFTMNPDGTMVMPYYGNATFRPNVVMFPRPVPDSHKILALFTAHHGQTHGAIGLIDNRKGVDGTEPLSLMTPGVPVTGEKAEDSRCGWFSDPVPLSEETYLCAFTPTVVPWHPATWSLYAGDRHGNLALVYRDGSISTAEPVPVVARCAPHQRPVVDHAGDELATVVLVNAGIGLSRGAAGAVAFVRIVEDVPRKGVRHGGVITTSGTPIYTIKRIIGTVPVDPDGSAHFTVPADRNVYFQLLDGEQREIRRMRSVVCLKPGETQTCVGCHESRQSAPPSVRISAPRRWPSRPVPPPWGDRPISFLRDIQPILNAKCIACHTHDRRSNAVILTDDLTDQFAVGYEELLPHLAVANAMRWDYPADVHAQPAYTYGSSISPLARLVSKEHHGVQLSEEDRLRIYAWIDANGVYYDRYETLHFQNRRIFGDQRKKAVQSIVERRCASCHGRSDGRFDTWWLSVNRRDVAKSRALVAPLARDAGGWQRCDGIVFADKADVDYRALYEILETLQNELTAHPRADLLSIHGTPAAHQRVTYPAAPPPRKVEALSGGWVCVSDLPWESASAGWTPNQDGLPRRDRDVTEGSLSLGGRIYAKGIGTHAPSRIAYRLDGKYERFTTRCGGAEAKGTVVFQVIGDGKLLHESATMRGLEGVETIDVGVAGVSKLELVVTDAGDRYFHDMANWADARLYLLKNTRSLRR